MRISSFNINKFCGPYSNKGQYFNPRNIDFKTPIKKIVDSLLENEDDIIFLQEFTDNKYINVEKLFPKDKYIVNSNDNLKIKSIVVAITLKGSLWKRIAPCSEDKHVNKFIEMNFDDKLSILSFQNTSDDCKEKINGHFEAKDKDIILGDFNDINWVTELNKGLGYRDLVTNDMITYKPGQTAIDRIFIKNGISNNTNNKIVFNGIVETFLSDHNLLTFSFNIQDLLMQ